MKDTLSQNLETKFIKTVCCPDVPDKIRTSLLSKVVADTFAFPPCQSAYHRIVSVFRSRAHLIDYYELMEDLLLEKDFREILQNKVSSSIEPCKSKKQIEKMLDVLDKYRKLRIVYQTSKQALDALRGDKVDIDRLLNNMSNSLARARSKAVLEEDMIILGKGGNARALMKDVIYGKEDPLLLTGFDAYDNANGGLPRSGVMIIASTTSGGKCIVGSSLVPTSNGLLTMREMWNNTCSSTQDSDGFRDYETGLVSHKGYAFCKKMYRTIGRTLKVEMNTGHMIEGLAEHKVWTYNDLELKFEFKRLNDLVKGDAVPRPLGTNLYAKKVPTINVDSVNKVFYAERSKAYRPGNFFVVDKLPQKLTLPLARLLGYLVSEGGGLRISATNREVIKDIENCATKCFGESVVLSNFEGVNLSIRHLELFFDSIGYRKVLSAKQSVPRIVRESPKRFWIEFLRSLYEGDGSIYSDGSNRYKIEYTTISKTLAYQVMSMLENIGIACFLLKGTTWATNGGKNQKSKIRYRVFIEKTSISQFITEIGFVSSEKRSISQKYLDHRDRAESSGRQNTVYYTTGNTNYLPVRNLLTQIFDLISQEIHLGRLFGRKIDTFFSRNRRVTRYLVDFVLSKRQEILEKCFDSRLPKLLAKLEMVSRYVYSEVESVVEQSKKPVYDFFVPGPHSYAVNGLMSHNSTMLTNLLKQIHILNLVDVCKVSLEMSAKQEMGRLASHLSSVPFKKIRQKTTTLDEKKKASTKLARFHEWGIENGLRHAIICPNAAVSMDDILMTLKPYRFDVLAIDYISLLDGVDSDNQWRVMGNITAQAKRYSRETNSLIIILAQLDDKSDTLRYSRAIRENADVYWYWNYSDEAKEARKSREIPIIVGKDRDGERLVFHLEERFDIMQFVNIKGSKAKPIEDEDRPMNRQEYDQDDDHDKMTEIKKHTGVS